MEIKINITEGEIKGVKIVRNYFGRKDKSAHQHMCYAILDNIFKKLNGNTEKREKKSFCSFHIDAIEHCDKYGGCYSCSFQPLK